MFQEYEELRIRYWEVGPGSYFVLANGPACRSTLIEEADPVSFHRELDALAGWEAPHDARVVRLLKQLAEKLTKDFFPKRIEECFHSALKQAQDSKMGLRLRFEFPPSLQNVPIEILKPRAYLGGRHDVSLARSHRAEDSIRDCFVPAGKLIIVLAGASPDDQPIDVDASIGMIEKALTFEITHNIVGILASPRTTRGGLRGLLERVDGPCIVVVIAHGDFDDQAGEGVVILEDDNHAADKVNEHDFVNLLTAAHQVRFACLNMCRGGQADIRARGHFSGIAGQLVGCGIPVVLASQFKTTGAIDLFVREMLIQLSQGCWIDEAAAVARGSLGAHQAGPVEWCLPALHLHPAYFRTQLLARRTANQDQGQPALDRMSANMEARRLREIGDWNKTLGYVDGAMRRYPGDRVLDALRQEAEVEAKVVPHCQEACAALTEGKTAEALSALQDVPKAFDILLKPLRNFAEGSRPPAPPGAPRDLRNGWEDIKKLFPPADLIGRE